MAIHQDVLRTSSSSSWIQARRRSSAAAATGKGDDETTKTATTTTTVYTFGDGWTGALGTGSLLTDQLSAAHPPLEEDDVDVDDEYLDALGSDPHYEGRGGGGGGLHPVLTLPPGDVVVKVACGWGHTAVIVRRGGDDDNELLVSGRSHELSSLLRLRRLPTILRDRFVVPLSDAWNSYGARDARQDGASSVFRPVSLPDGDAPVDVVASAGVTYVVGRNAGRLYAFGMNHHGQCGVASGELGGRDDGDAFTLREHDADRNVWTPTPVGGLGHDGEAVVPVVSVAAGLQHGLAADANGVLYAWGKGDRGRLGNGGHDTAWTASPVRRFASPRPPRIVRVAAGLAVSACVDEDDGLWVWGRGVATANGAAADATTPTLVPNESSSPIRGLACGSHHASVLHADGSVRTVGVATDDGARLFDRAVETMPPSDPGDAGDDVDASSFFGAGFDRTTVVSADGRRVREASLWSDAEARRDAVFEPACARAVLERDAGARVTSLLRGWLHSAIVATTTTTT